MPRKGSFKSSLRKTPKKKPAGKKKSKEKEVRTFVIKPIPTPNITPVLVFINPKSGGNQGAKLLQKFQWLLNPRQVFDLTQGGPKMGYVQKSIIFHVDRQQHAVVVVVVLNEKKIYDVVIWKKSF